jgi:two-component system, response regulator YesN
MKKFNLASPFQQFILSYFLILLIPLALGIILYTTMIGPLKTNAQELNISVLHQSMNTMEEEINNIEELVRMSTLEGDIYTLFNKHRYNINTLPFTINNAREELNHFLTINDFIKFGYIYYADLDILLSDERAFMEPDKFYNDFFSAEDYSLEAWMEHVETNYLTGKIQGAADFTIDGKPIRMISYHQRLPLGVLQDIRGVISLYIDIEDINKLFQTFFPEQNRSIFIMNSDNEIITTYLNPGEEYLFTIDQLPDDLTGQGSFTIGKGRSRQVISYIRSPQSGWLYVAAVPFRILMANIQFIYLISIVSLLIFFSIGIVLSYFFAKRNSDPISEILQTNSSLKETLVNQQPLLKSQFLNKLFSGLFPALEAVQEQSRYLHLDLSGEYFSIAVIETDPYQISYNRELLNRLQLATAQIADAAAEVFHGNCFAARRSTNRVAVMLCHSTADKVVIENRTNSFITDLQQLLQSYNLNLYFGIGGHTDNLLDIGELVNNALRALRYTDYANKKQVVHAKDLSQSFKGYFFPINQEIKLVNMIKSGNAENAVNLINDLLNSNITTKNSNQGILFYNDLLCMLLKVVDEIQMTDTTVSELLQNISDMLINQQDMKLIHEKIATVINALCKKQTHQKNSKNRLFCNQIDDFLDTNYHDKQLNLRMIADKFGLSEVYISHFYKEYTGGNLFISLEKIRMRQAKELLSTTDKTMEYISDVTGFSSSHSFRRVFKKNFGITPNVFRNQVNK